MLECDLADSIRAHAVKHINVPCLDEVGLGSGVAPRPEPGDPDPVGVFAVCVLAPRYALASADAPPRLPTPSRGPASSIPPSRAWRHTPDRCSPRTAGRGESSHLGRRWDAPRSCRHAGPECRTECGKLVCGSCRTGSRAAGRPASAESGAGTRTLRAGRSRSKRGRGRSWTAWRW